MQVKGTRLEGYASSSVGDISLDCATTRSGNICGSSNYGVCNGPGPKDPTNLDGTCDAGDASGELTGYAWNDTTGWISFNCDQSSHSGSNDCASSNYKVLINQNTGDFSGYAWNDTNGWISFNCANNTSCGVNNFKMNTLWRATSTFGYLESSIFDTQDPQGTILKKFYLERKCSGQHLHQFPDCGLERYERSMELFRALRRCKQLLWRLLLSKP